MDSSRSGLLSTLIMTIPLIVVPAIALLRPAAPNQGLATTALEASSGDDFFNEEFGEFSLDDFGNQKPNPQMTTSRTGSDDYSELFAEETESNQAPPADHEHSHESNHLEDPFAVKPGTIAGREADVSTNNAGSNVPDVSLRNQGVEASVEKSLLQQLTTAGAAKTLWFSPGQLGKTGFAAFVPIPQTSTQYRFEAIATTRADAVRNVLQQIVAWRAQQQAGR